MSQAPAGTARVRAWASGKSRGLPQHYVVMHNVPMHFIGRQDELRRLERVVRASEGGSWCCGAGGASARRGCSWSGAGKGGVY
jgi:hypothetical protein